MKLAIAVTLAAAFLAGCESVESVYVVKIVPEAGITVDGELGEPAWGRAGTLIDFEDPWTRNLASGTAASVAETTFKAIADDKNLYFAFTCRENTPKVERMWQGKKTLNNEDRVEIYFAPDENLDPYYCVEIDPEGRVHDFAASLPRRFDESWSMPGLRTAGKKTASGYVVEGSIPLASLEALGLPPARPGQSWRVGLFRADLGKAGAGSDRWITWVRPNSEKPDFHTPSAFGVFRFR